MGAYDWAQVRSALTTNTWTLLATDEKYTIAEAVRAGRVKAMAGVKVSTRNNHYVDGVRRCDIYLQESETE